MLNDFSVLQGSFSEVIGPLIPELAFQTNVKYYRIAQSVSMRGAGLALGGIIGMLLCHLHGHII